MLIDCDGVTVSGKTRETNEDQFLIADLNKSMLIQKTSLLEEDSKRVIGEPQGKLLVVADGVGGRPGGEIASKLGVESMVRYVLNTMPWFYSLGSDYTYEIGGKMKESFELCRFQIRAAAKIIGKEGMATTLTMAYINWPRLYLIHVGDARTYLFRSEELEQISTDHTMAEEIAKRTEVEASKTSPFRNVLLDAVGMDTEDDDYEGIKTEFKASNLREGDVLIMCTDGVSDYVDDEKITSAIENSDTSQAICLKLITYANEGGSNDDITAIVARFGKNES